jgi:hypothetical protein
MEEYRYRAGELMLYRFDEVVPITRILKYDSFAN